MGNNKIEPLAELLKLTRADLYKTIHIINTLLPDDDSYEYYSRSYVREYAAWLESTLYVLKHAIGHIEYNWYKELTTVEQLYIHDIDWKVQRGKVKESKGKKIGVIDNLKSFLCICKKLFKDFDYQLNTKGWESVQSLVSRRDNLMHPKDSASFSVSPEDLRYFDLGRVWLKEIFSNIMKCMVERIDNEELKS